MHVCALFWIYTTVYCVIFHLYFFNLIASDDSDVKTMWHIKYFEQIAMYFGMIKWNNNTIHTHISDKHCVLIFIFSSFCCWDVENGTISCFVVRLNCFTHYICIWNSEFDGYLARWQSGMASLLELADVVVCCEPLINKLVLLSKICFEKSCLQGGVKSPCCITTAELFCAAGQISLVVVTFCFNFTFNPVQCGFDPTSIGWRLKSTDFLRINTNKSKTSHQHKIIISHDFELLWLYLLFEWSCFNWQLDSLLDIVEFWWTVLHFELDVFDYIWLLNDHWPLLTLLSNWCNDM